jgi:NADH:ubiquinone oxidoreductase subunit H
MWVMFEDIYWFFINSGSVSYFISETNIFLIKYSVPVNKAIIYSIKLVAMLSFLLLMRGGTPRYRYDYLTKLGWLKFLSYNLFMLIIISFFFLIV